MSVGLASITHLLEPPLEDWCSGVGYLPANHATTSVHAVKVIVEPFLGRHQVYAIFQLDREKSPPGKPVILTVVGAGKYCESTNPIGQQFEGIEAAPGYYLSQHYIRTRTAIWLSLQGMFKQLKQPQSWTLTYIE
ncbi:hypothetical protein [Allocoleopsis sp.]|uniref:hypothetical protein n=1 Tax=Allocoleopsis sp. TaxID=3088169 RepID=UPI002FD2B322